MKNVLPGYFNLMEIEFSGALAESFKELLENKHLYQSINVSFPPFDVVYQNVARIPNIIGNNDDSHNRLNECQLTYDSANEFEWRIPSPREAGRLPMGGGQERITAVIDFTPPTIKTFCSVCESIQPYNFIRGIDFSKDFREINNYQNSVDIQVFMLAYQCQSCKNMPEVFMIRREKMKITQSGRTPMEQVNVPKFIPKAQREYFSDAIIAFNSGQILAGKFLFRTFIEQYIRTFTENHTSQNTDELFEKYAASLPDDFKQRFPSLAKIYAQLSVDIHGADASSDSFIQAQKDIQKHFEAKKIFEIQ